MTPSGDPHYSILILCTSNSARRQPSHRSRQSVRYSYILARNAIQREIRAIGQTLVTGEHDEPR